MNTPARFCALVICIGMGLSQARAQEQTIDFEGLPAGTVVWTVSGDLGAGPIAVSGVNPVLPGNAAIIFNSSVPSGGDVDLGSPNQTCPNGGPGQGSGGEVGAMIDGRSTENCPAVPLGNILIVAEDLVDGDGDGLIDDPDDAALRGAMLSFDFSSLGSVSITSMTLVDVESDEDQAVIKLYADSARSTLLDSFDLARTGNNGVLVFDLGTNPDVVIMDVVLNGSGAIDNVVFTPGPCPPGTDCDDQDACTVDACDPLAGGCVHTPKDCDDGDACTVDACDPQTGGCVHTPVNCDDQDGCTVDSCDPQTGACMNTPKDCTDDDACSIDSCDPQSGSCVHTPRDCDDSDPCTIDSCDPQSGACMNMPKSCDDGEACTIDSCDPQSGACMNTPKDCSDGEACTLDFCDPQSGSCMNTPRNCDDGDGCTTDTCDPQSGECMNTPRNCDDGDGCTTDTCDPQAGSCVNTPVNCDDQNDCTVDSCDPQNGGCVNESMDCADDEICTEDYCFEGQCYHEFIDECCESLGGCDECTLQVSVSCAVQTPPSTDFECRKPIDVLTMIWDGDQAVRIKAWKGSVGSTLLADIDGIEINDEVTVDGFAGSPNNVYWEVFVAGTSDRLGVSVFHLSCSDGDLDGPEDCGKRQGNAKDDGDNLVNDWILEGMVDAVGTLDCSGTTTPAGSSCEFAGPGAEITYTYVITNTGSADVYDIVVFDDELGAVEGSPIGLLPSGHTTMLQEVVFVDEDTTSEVTVHGRSELAATCEASDMITVTVIPPPPCVVEGGEFKLSDDKIEWKLFNVGDEMATIASIYIEWPVEHGYLEKVKLHGDIFKSLRPPTSTTIDSFIKDLEDRQLEPGKDKRLVIEFKGKAKHARPDDYVVIIEFEEGCAIELEVPVGQFECDKPIDSLTMIWDGDEAVRIRAWKGTVGSTLLADIDDIEIGDEVTVEGFAGSPNDVYWEVFAAGTSDRLGKSRFHLSCSDSDMNGPEDCAKAQGDGKDDNSEYINDWLLEGMIDKAGVLDCTP